MNLWGSSGTLEEQAGEIEMVMIFCKMKVTTPNTFCMRNHVRLYYTRYRGYASRGMRRAFTKKITCSNTSWAHNAQARHDAQRGDVEGTRTLSPAPSTVIQLLRIFFSLMVYSSFAQHCYCISPEGITYAAINRMGRGSEFQLP